MKKYISRSFLAILLAFVLLFNPVSSIKKAYAAEVVGTVSAVVGIVSFAMSVLTSVSSSAAQKAEQREALRASWVTPPSSSSYRIRVSGDDLSNACMELVGSGIPCKIVYNSTISGYMIQCIDEPRNSKNGTRVDEDYSYYNKYFGYSSNRNSPNASLYTYVFYSTSLDSASILDQIRSALSTMQTTLINITTILDNVRSYVDQIEGYIDGIEGYIDGVESSLDHLESYTDGIEGDLVDINTTLSSYTSLLTHVLYASGTLTDSNSTAYSSVTLPYDVATFLCGYLNASFVGQSFYTLPREDSSNPGLSPSGSHEFYYANIEGSYIRIIGRTSSGQTSYYLCSKRHVIYRVASPNTINVSGDINATLDDTDIINALDTINNSIQGLSISDNTILQYCVSYSSYSDGTPYPTITIPYETASSLCAILNVEIANQRLIRLYDRDATNFGTYVFLSAYVQNGFIRVTRQYSGGYSSANFLCLPYTVSGSTKLIRISVADPIYKAVLDSVDSKLDDIETALYGQVQTRAAGALVPVGETALSILNSTALVESSTSLIVSDFGSLIAPEVGILALAGDILDAIVDGSGNSSITQRLDQIKNKIDTTNDKLDDLNDNVESILAWLDDSDLADYATIDRIIDNWSSDVVSSLANSANILSLFESAYGDSANLYVFNDWQTAKDYFTNFWGN